MLIKLSKTIIPFDQTYSFYSLRLNTLVHLDPTTTKDRISFMDTKSWVYVANPKQNSGRKQQWSSVVHWFANQCDMSMIIAEYVIKARFSLSSGTFEYFKIQTAESWMSERWNGNLFFLASPWKQCFVLDKYISIFQKPFNALII